jgi:hypothetical protein
MIDVWAWKVMDDVVQVSIYIMEHGIYSITDLLLLLGKKVCEVSVLSFHELQIYIYIYMYFNIYLQHVPLPGNTTCSSIHFIH